eukprot:scaffold348_cov151-Skeletonema_dohrnii-CCMP3373.AAC.2
MLCSADGCTSQVCNGGVCMKHGARRTKKLCNSEGCTTQDTSSKWRSVHKTWTWDKEEIMQLCNAQIWREKRNVHTLRYGRGHYAVSMDAKVKLRMEVYASSMVRNLERYCAAGRMNKQSRQWRSLRKTWGKGHEAKKKRCRIEGCTNNVIKGGVCIWHGAKVEHGQRCSIDIDRCKRGICVKTGAKVKLCKNERLTNEAYRQEKMCMRHGMKEPCAINGITTQVRNGQNGSRTY